MKKKKQEEKVVFNREDEKMTDLACDSDLPLIRELVGEDVLVVLESHQLNILGQTFRPIFTGRIAEVTVGFITLVDVIIKMPNAPFFQFPTPLSFPIEKVVGVTRFDPETILPVT